MKNSGQKVLSVVVLMIGIMVIGIVISHNIKKAQIENQKPHIETGYNPIDSVIAERPAIKFHPGDTLTSKENGAWMLWDSTMIKELQVAYVTDSGTIEVLK
jgi:hypothetical protein